MENSSVIEHGYTQHPYKIKYKYDKFKERLTNANLRLSEDLKLIKTELLFRLIEPFIYELSKFNGLSVDINDEEQLELICQVEKISGCPIVMTRAGGGMYVCLDLLRVEPLVFEEIYSLMYLYKSNNSFKNYNEDYFDSIYVGLDNSANLYEILKVSLHTNNDKTQEESTEKNIKKIVLLFEVYDKQIGRKRGNKEVGRGTKETPWKTSEFYVNKTDKLISYSSAYSYINLIEEALNHIVCKCSKDREQNNQLVTCRTKSVKKNIERHVLKKSNTNVITHVSNSLYNFRYGDMQIKKIKLKKLFRDDVLKSLEKFISKIKLDTERNTIFFKEEDSLAKDNILEELMMMIYINIDDYSIHYYMQSIYQVDIKKELPSLRFNARGERVYKMDS